MRPIGSQRPARVKRHRFDPAQVAYDAEPGRDDLHYWMSVRLGATVGMVASAFAWSLSLMACVVGCSGAAPVAWASYAAGLLSYLVGRGATHMIDRSPLVHRVRIAYDLDDDD